MSTTEKEVIKTAKKRYAVGQEAWGHFFRDAKETLQFIAGDQWDNQIRVNRENAGVPVLTANALPTFLRQITNESRMNVPAIQIDPKGDGADQDTAEIFGDLIRGIENHSGAASAYDIAGWYAAATGLGYFRVVSEYEDPESFFQKLCVKQIEDPSTVIIDPLHKKLDGSDAEWCFVTSTISKEEYKRSYSSSALAKALDEKGFTTNDTQWIREDEIVIAEYYFKEYTPATLYQVFNVQTGQTIVSTDKPSEELIAAGVLIILNTRSVEEITVRWCKINDMEILEETTWPGTVIPVVAVKGDESWINGKRIITGAVADAKDSQRALNFFFSLQAELVSLAPKAPFVGEIRQFKNYEHLWRDANTAPSAYLPYNAVVEGGQLLPKPERQTNEVPIQSAIALCQQARDNMKAIFGIFDASLGNKGNETSGVAILTRQTQTHTTTYHFYDNLVKAVTQCGNILVETIPVFYSDERDVQLVKRNGETSTTTINRPDGTADLTSGKYGVVVETGPSYATRRQDSVTHMTALGEVYPNAMPLIADIIASESDWPGAKQVANRLRMALPPEIQQAEAAAGQMTSQQQAAQAISQVRQLSQQVQQLTESSQHAQQLLKNADDEIKLLKMKGAVDLEKARMDGDIKEKQMRLDEVTSELEYKVKSRELDIQEAQLKLEGGNLAIKASSAMHTMNKDGHEIAVAHMDRAAANAPGFNKGTIEARAEGGGENSGQPYLVGENGPEIIVPKQSGTVIPNPNTDSPHSVSQQRFSDLMTKAASGSMHVGLAIPRALGGSIIGSDDGGDANDFPQSQEEFNRAAASQEAHYTQAQAASGNAMRLPEQGLGTDITSDFAYGAGGVASNFVASKGVPAEVAGGIGAVVNAGFNAFPMLLSTAIPSKAVTGAQAMQTYATNLGKLRGIISDAGQSAEDAITATARDAIRSGKAEVNDILGSTLNESSGKLTPANSLASPDKFVNQASNQAATSRQSSKRDLLPFDEMTRKLSSLSPVEMNDYLASELGQMHTQILNRTANKYSQPILSKIDWTTPQNFKLPAVASVGAATVLPAMLGKK